jgi:DnaD/phage-associated family protein
VKTFAGFPPGKSRFTSLPDLFYTALLPAIDDLAELQLTLYMFWALGRQQGYPRYLTERELEGEGLLLSALGTACPGADQAALVERLHQAIERAVARGSLLRLTVASSVDSAEQVEHYIFVNTPQGRKAVAEVQRGELILERPGVVREAHIDQPRANIYELYEQNIGLLPPLLLDDLKDAEQTYPPEWIHDAFRIAVAQNARRWRYVLSILERWAREGKDEGLPQARSSARRTPRSVK